MFIFSWLISAIAVHPYDFKDDSKYLAPASFLHGWHETTLRSQVENSSIEACIANETLCSRHMRSIRKLIVRGRELSTQRRIQLVNFYINRLRRYSSDRRSLKELDDYSFVVRQEWSTLLEFLQKGGDCEDYATAKYTLLKFVGFKPKDLRIVVVYDRTTREHHAVIAVRLSESDTRILDIDNQVYRVRPAMYRYIYALNEESIWDHALENVRKPRRINQ